MKRLNNEYRKHGSIGLDKGAGSLQLTNQPLAALQLNFLLVLTDLELETLRRTAHLETAQEVLEGRVSLRAEHAAEALLVHLQFAGDFGDGFRCIQLVAQQRYFPPIIWGDCSLLYCLLAMRSTWGFRY